MRTSMTRLRAGAAAAVLILLAACGGSGENDAGAPSAPADATVVEVSATEYAFTVTTTTLPAGTLTFELTNDGQMSHDLVLEEDPGGATAAIGPGETDSFTVELEPGTYTLYCSVGNHRALGMELTVVVE